MLSHGSYMIFKEDSEWPQLLLQQLYQKSQLGCLEPSYSVQSFERGLSGIQSSKPRRGSLWLLTFNWSRVPVPQHANGCLILFNYRFVFVSDFHVCVLTRSQDRDHFQFVTFFHKSVNRSLVISRGRLRPSEFQRSTFISGS